MFVTRKKYDALREKLEDRIEKHVSDFAYTSNILNKRSHDLTLANGQLKFNLAELERVKKAKGISDKRVAGMTSQRKALQEKILKLESISDLKKLQKQIKASMPHMTKRKK